MTQSENAILGDTQRGTTVEADGNAPTQSVQLGGGLSLALDSQNDPQAQALGPNNERLEQAAPRLVNALRELVVKFREEGIVARRDEIRRIRQARLGGTKSAAFAKRGFSGKGCNTPGGIHRT